MQNITNAQKTQVTTYLTVPGPNDHSVSISRPVASTALDMLNTESIIDINKNMFAFASSLPGQALKKKDNAQ